MTKKSEFIDAVQNGHTTVETVADVLGLSKEYTSRRLRELTEEGRLSRERDGSPFVYSIPEDTGGSATQPAADDNDGLMPVNRNYDWDDPSYKAHPDEYFATNGEVELGQARINGLDTTHAAVRILVDGPTGCGKTTYAEVIADTNDAVFMTLQMSKDMTDAALLGSPTFAGGETMWVDGPVTKALLASQERLVVLLIDEVNRAPAHVKNALFAALDHRGSVRLDGPRGGEVIQGNPENIVVIATMNQGDPYHGTERMDLAEKTRYTTRFSVDYLAADPNDLDGIEREAELLVKRTPVHADLARAMVETAAHVRAEANSKANTTIDFGVPTRSLLAWAATAYDFHSIGADNPIVVSGEAAIASVLYGDDGMENAYDEVLGIIEDRLDGTPFEESGFHAHQESEMVACGDCDYLEPKSVAEESSVLAMAMCPECGSENLRVIQQN